MAGSRKIYPRYDPNRRNVSQPSQNRYRNTRRGRLRRMPGPARKVGREGPGKIFERRRARGVRPPRTRALADPAASGGRLGHTATHREITFLREHAPLLERVMRRTPRRVSASLTCLACLRLHVRALCSNALFGHRSPRRRSPRQPGRSDSAIVRVRAAVSSTVLSPPFRRSASKQ